MMAPMMEAADTSETPVNFYQTTRRNPEDSHLQTDFHINVFMSEERLEDSILTYILLIM
jgi:hypothetical protein